MWKRLPEAQIAELEQQEARRRRRIGGPLLIAALMATAIATLWALGYRGGQVSSRVMLLGQAHRLTDPRTVLVFALSFGTTFVLAYRKQRRTGQWLLGDAPSVICNQCQRLAEPGQSSACACGGIWESIDHWEWVP